MRRLGKLFKPGVLVCGLVLCLENNVEAELRLESAFTLSQSYTDNLFYKDTNRKSDFGTFFGPNLTLLFENPDIVLGASYFGRVALFINNPDANQYIQNANIILDLPFLTKRYKGLTVTIDETMRFTPQLDAFSLSGAQDLTSTNQSFQNYGGGKGSSNSAPGNSPGGPLGGLGGGYGGGIGGNQGLFTSRASAFYNTAGINLGYEWTPRVQTSLRYTNNYLHFFSGGFQDSIRHVGNSSLSYKLTDQTTVTPTYTYWETDFIGKSTQSSSGEKIITHSPRLGISHVLTPSLTVSVTGGVAFLKEIGGKEEVSGPDNTTKTERDLSEKWQTQKIGAASVTKTYSRGEVILTFNQTIGSGAGVASQATRNRFVTARVNHHLSPRMHAFSSFGWAQNKSTEGNALDTTTYRIQAGLGYSFTTWLLGNLSYSHIDQNSKGSAGNALKVDQFFLGLTAVADPWVIVR